MKQILNCYSDAAAAWESWYLTECTEKQIKLSALEATLSERLKPAFHYQRVRAAAAVAEPLSLISPTGETNELYTQGRGVSLLVIDSKEEAGTKALAAMLAALLVAGNSVIICSDDNEIISRLKSSLKQAELPENLVQFAAKESYIKLAKQDIRNVVFIGARDSVCEINQLLAFRTGAITSLVAETDLTMLPNSKDPMLALRFITEKVRSVNITAIGGNAMLLELGNDAH